LRLNSEQFLKVAKEAADIALESFSDPWSFSSFTSLCKSNNSCFYFFAEFDESSKMLAYLIFSVVEDTAEVLDIAVKSTHRKQGIGEKLLNESFVFAKENRVSVIFLEVRESNLPARTLYEKLGFFVSGKRRNYYENPAEDAVLMSKLLT